MPSDRAGHTDYLVGVTGGIGSGKSTVCALFAKLGRTVISADTLAKQIADSDPAVKESIMETFGADSYTADGKLDRHAMASRIFHDASARAHLEEIIHPRVFSRLGELLQELPETAKRPYLLVEAALVYESGMDELLDAVIVVDASEEARIARVTGRDSVTRSEVLQRIHAQAPVAGKLSRADFVVRNDAGEAALEAKVRFLDNLLTRLSSRPLTNS